MMDTNDDVSIAAGLNPANTTIPISPPNLQHEENIATQGHLKNDVIKTEEGCHDISNQGDIQNDEVNLCGGDHSQARPPDAFLQQQPLQTQQQQPPLMQGDVLTDFLDTTYQQPQLYPGIHENQNNIPVWPNQLLPACLGYHGNIPGLTHAPDLATMQLFFRFLSEEVIPKMASNYSNVNHLPSYMLPWIHDPVTMGPAGVGHLPGYQHLGTGVPEATLSSQGHLLSDPTPTFGHAQAVPACADEVTQETQEHSASTRNFLLADTEDSAPHYDSNRNSSLGLSIENVTSLSTRPLTTEDKEDILDGKYTSSSGANNTSLPEDVLGSISDDSDQSESFMDSCLEDAEDIFDLGTEILSKTQDEQSNNPVHNIAETVTFDKSNFATEVEQSFGNMLKLNTPSKQKKMKTFSKRCDLCDREFTTSWGLMKHSESHRQISAAGTVKSYQCKPHQLYFVNKSFADKHYREVHNGEDYTEVMADLNPKSAKKKTSTPQRHKKDKPSGTSSKSVQPCKFPKVTTERPDDSAKVCGTCGRKFSTRNALTLHLKLHVRKLSTKTPGFCNKCKILHVLSQKRWQKFRQHRMSCHLSPAQNQGTMTTPDLSLSRPDLDDTTSAFHILDRSRHDTDAASTVSQPEGDLDDKHSSLSDILTSDLESAQTFIAGADDFQCVRCPLGFPNKRALKTHEEVHNPKRKSGTWKPYWCSDCPHYYNRESQLTAHTRQCHEASKRR